MSKKNIPLCMISSLVVAFLFAGCASVKTPDFIQHSGNSEAATITVGPYVYIRSLDGHAVNVRSHKRISIKPGVYDAEVLIYSRSVPLISGPMWMRGSEPTVGWVHLDQHNKAKQWLQVTIDKSDYLVVGDVNADEKEARAYVVDMSNSQIVSRVSAERGGVKEKIFGW